MPATYPRPTHIPFQLVSSSLLTASPPTRGVGAKPTFQGHSDTMANVSNAIKPAYPTGMSFSLWFTVPERYPVGHKELLKSNRARVGLSRRRNVTRRRDT